MASAVGQFPYIHEAEEGSKINFYCVSIEGIQLKFVFIFFPPLFCNLSGCGLPLLGDSKHLLEKQTSGFAFLFLLFHRVPVPPFSEDLCSCY